MPPTTVVTPALSTSDSVAVGSPIGVRWNLPQDFTPSPNDWISLASLDMADSQYMNGWKYTGGTRTGEVTLAAPPLPGPYEIRFYPNNGLTVYQRTPLSVVVPAPLAHVQNIEAAEMQGYVDHAIAGSGILALEDDALITFTSERRNLRVYGDLCVVPKNKRAMVRIGPDLPTWNGPGWCLFRLEPGNYKFEVKPGVGGIGAKHKIVWLQEPERGYSGPDPKVPVPNFIESIAAKQPGLNRLIKVQGLHLVSDPRDVRGFSTAFHIEPNAPGSVTSLHAFDNHIDVLGAMCSAFGSGGKIWVSRNYILAGWDTLYHCGYVHQGHELTLTENEIVTRDGKACWKYAGQGSEGGSRARIAGNLFRSGRVEFRKLIGLPTTDADERWGVGLEMDKFIPECEIEGNEFDRSLWIALQHAGGFNMKGGVIKSAYAFIQFGDLTGFPVPPICSVQGTRFQDISHIMHSKLEGATWVFDDVIVDSDEVATLFATSQRPQNVYVSGYARIRNNGAAFQKGPGEWDTSRLIIV